MKILAFSDLHASVTEYKRLQAKVKKHKPDYIFCLGDFTIFEQNIEAVLRKISQLKKPTLVIHGNHETDIIVKRLCKDYDNLTFAHKKIIKLGDHTFVVHGGGGFYGQGKHLKGDKDFDTFVKANKVKFKGKLILLTHAPPAFTKLDYLDWIGDHVGCTSYNKFIKKYQPQLALSGHLHENFGVKQKIGKTLVCNVGPEGRIFTV